MKTYPSIAELVPHQAPMLALDCLIDWEPGRALAQLTLRPDSLFAREGLVDSVVALEYMAQAVAACLGMEVYTEGGGMRVGMIVVCRQMEISCPTLEVGEVYEVEVRRVRGNENLSYFETSMRDADGVVIATSNLTLVHGEKPPDESA